MRLAKDPQGLPSIAIVPQSASGPRCQRPILIGRHRTKFWTQYKRPERIKEANGQDRFYCNLPHSSSRTRLLSYKNMERHLQLQHGKPPRALKLPSWQCPYCINCDCCNGGRGLPYYCVASSKSRHLRSSRRDHCKHLPPSAENSPNSTAAIVLTNAYIRQTT